MKNIAKVAALTLALTSSAHTTHAETVTKAEMPSLTAGISNQLNIYSKSNDSTKYEIMYVSGTNVNIRTLPSKSSKVIKTVEFNDSIEVDRLSDSDWYIVNLKDKIGYIHKKYVTNKPFDYSLINVPYAKNKTWMPYTAITSKSSNQYKLQLIATTGKYGIRTVDGRYCVALGSYFNCEIGQYFDLVLANGTVIKCIMADQKSDKHTDSRNIITVDTNCMSEFIVDKNALNKYAKRDGDISSCCKEWNSPVKQVRVYKKVVEF